MLKLMRFPRGTNRNRTIKPQKPLHIKKEIDSVAEVERIFRRFWHERTVLFTHHDNPFSAGSEEGDTVCD